MRHHSAVPRPREGLPHCPPRHPLRVRPRALKEGLTHSAGMTMGSDRATRLPLYALLWVIASNTAEFTGNRPRDTKRLNARISAARNLIERGEITAMTELRQLFLEEIQPKWKRNDEKGPVIAQINQMIALIRFTFATAERFGLRIPHAARRDLAQLTAIDTTDLDPHSKDGAEVVTTKGEQIVITGMNALDNLLPRQRKERSVQKDDDATPNETDKDALVN